ncbi:MAG: prenyltransferase/squalene oxidase repeat-containing protein [Solirubrobacteraceae bacterium]
MLETIAGVVPAFAALGLECRLTGRGTPALDMQFGACAGREAAAAARGLARARAREELPEVWEPVHRLCHEWRSPDSILGRGVAEVWCELDLIPDAEPIDLAALAPSVFVALRRRGAVERMAVIERALELLVGGDAAQPLRAAVEGCVTACPDGAWISHLGLMLGRSTRALRIHVSGVPLWALGDYLTAAGWPGDADRAIAAAGLLLDCGDWLVLCLDVVGDLLPRLGLECGFDQRWATDPRWEPLLIRLVDAGLSSDEKTQGLLSWPGINTPADPAAWPDALIAAGVSLPAHALGVVERRLSHVKIAVGSTEPPIAKAYFGAGHVARDLLGAEPVVAVKPERRPAASVAEAIAAALAYLLGRRNQAGWWLDFVHRARPLGVDQGVTGYRSDEWVTAYVATAVVGLDDPHARDAAATGMRLLLARRNRGGWGYNMMIPGDADTTTWVLRLAAGLGLGDGAHLREARAFVTGQIGPDGGVATYPAAAAPALADFTRLPGPYDGWCGTHVCVTAAAAALDLGPAPLEFLRRAQCEDGSWSGYWWHDDEYATARVVEALSAPGDRPSVARALRWAASRIGPDGAAHSVAHGGPSPFATALALDALAVGGAPRRGARGRAVGWLLSEQRTDGSWEPSAQLRIPAPDQDDPSAAPDTTSNYVDDLAVFTTATVLAALAQE